MKIFRIIIILVLAAVLAAAMWYFRPWSDYSPSKFAALEQADKLTYNFTHMADLVPSRPIKASDSPRPLSNGDVVDVGAITYTFDGQTKTVAEFIEQASVLGLLVHHRGNIVYEDYFQGTNQNSLYTSWSMAKSVVATLIAMAVQEGRIDSLDDPASKYAPQYLGSHFGETSLRALLAMSSGIDFDENYASDSSDIRPFFFNSFILRRDPDSLLMGFKRDRNAMQDHHYISPNSHVLSAVVRGIYDMRLADIVQTKVWQPLGMANDANWLQHSPDDDGQALGYCCLNATLRDYARFGLFNLDASLGRAELSNMLPAEWSSLLPVPATPAHVPGRDSYQGRGYSYHYWLPINRAGIYFAAGVYGQFVWIDPANELVIARTSSDPNWTPRYPESEAVFHAITDHITKSADAPSADLILDADEIESLIE